MSEKEAVNRRCRPSRELNPAALPFLGASKLCPLAPDRVLIQLSEGSMVHRTLTPLGRMGLVAPDGSSAGG